MDDPLKSVADLESFKAESLIDMILDPTPSLYIIQQENPDEVDDIFFGALSFGSVEAIDHGIFHSDSNLEADPQHGQTDGFGQEPNVQTSRLLRLKPIKMLPKQEAKLKEAVLKDLVRIALEQLAISKENVEKILTEKVAKGLPHKTFANKLEIIDRKIKDVNVNSEKWYRDKNVYQFELIDWEKIASEVFQNQIGYDGVFLRQWWKVHLDPSFTRGELTAKEVELLKKLTKDCNPEEFIDFQAIALQISTKLKLRKRHVFQLGQYHEMKLNCKKIAWTKDESEELGLLYNEISTEKILNKDKVWSTVQAHFPRRSVAAIQRKLSRLSTPPASSSAKRLPAAIKAVATTSKRGRPKKPENSALDQEITDLLKPLKSIRRGRKRTSSLPGDGRGNGMVLSAIQRLLPLKMDQGNIPREASEFMADGVSEKDVGAVQTTLSLPHSSLNFTGRFPANLASLTGLRGLLLTQEEESQAEVNEVSFGDPEEDEHLLSVFFMCFGFARPYFDPEASADGLEVNDQEGFD